MKKFLKWIVGGFFTLVVLSAIVNASKKPEYSDAEQALLESKKNSNNARSEGDLSSKTDGSTERDGLTGPQRNAVRAATQYLSIQGFSRNGLIQQLYSDAGDKYEVADATKAVDSLTVDWNEQAARSAKQYLAIQGFSCKGLINQLSSTAGDKYTVSQATYGAKQSGAC